MNRVADYLFAILITLWVGALWSFGFVAMILFRELADKQVVGAIAGQLFRDAAWLGIAASIYAIVFLFMRENARAMKSATFWIVVFMLLFTLAGHFGVTPILAHLKADAFPREVMESALRSRFVAWHGVSSVLYLVESVLGIALITQLFKR